MGALLVAPRRDGRFVYAGKVGTGFDRAMRRRLLTLLKKDEVPQPAIEDAPRMRDAHWVLPRHVAELEFTEWTRDGKLRHPSFKGLREDKGPEEIGQDAPSTAGAPGPARAGKARASGRRAAARPVSASRARASAGRTSSARKTSAKSRARSPRAKGSGDRATGSRADPEESQARGFFGTTPA